MESVDLYPPEPPVVIEPNPFLRKPTTLVRYSDRPRYAYASSMSILGGGTSKIEVAAAGSGKIQDPPKMGVSEIADIILKTPEIIPPLRVVAAARNEIDGPPWFGIRPHPSLARNLAEQALFNGQMIGAAPAQGPAAPQLGPPAPAVATTAAPAAAAAAAAAPDGGGSGLSRLWQWFSAAAPTTTPPPPAAAAPTTVPPPAAAAIPPPLTAPPPPAAAPPPPAAAAPPPPVQLTAPQPIAQPVDPTAPGPAQQPVPTSIPAPTANSSVPPSPPPSPPGSSAPPPPPPAPAKAAAPPPRRSERLKERSEKSKKALAAAAAGGSGGMMNSMRSALERRRAAMDPQSDGAAADDDDDDWGSNTNLPQSRAAQNAAHIIDAGPNVFQLVANDELYERLNAAFSRAWNGRGTLPGADVESFESLLAYMRRTGGRITKEKFEEAKYLLSKYGAGSSQRP